MASDSLPVGTILAYPVDAIDPQFSTFWQLCQGGQMNKGQYPELFAAIGYCNGSSSDPNIFYLPNLQGCFLRGVDDTGNIDVDKNKRTTVTGEKATLLAGSLQGHATAKPSGLQLSVPYLPQGYHWINTGDSGPAAYCMMEYNSGFVDYTLQLPCQESVPVNMYMQYIIKVKPTVALPIGSIISYAGAPTQSPDPYAGLWAPCDGTSERTTTPQFEKLYALLGARYGLSPDESEFFLPNLQGMFIRGVDINSGRDKNGNRKQPAGITGTAPAAGSTQAFGTAQANSPLIARLWHVGVGATTEVFKIAGYYNVRGGEDSSNAQYWSGGDLETRPTNANVQFFTAMASEQLSADITPVGTISAIPGDGVPDPTFWAACDGSSVLRTTYPQLFTACNTLKGPIWGSKDSDHFYLPDLRGKFLRGVDNTPAPQTGVDPGIDPDRFRRHAPQAGSGSTKGTGSVQDCATSIDHVSIDISLPTTNWMNAATAVGDLAEDYTSDAATCQIYGGDNETRPTNIAVRFYIKCALPPSLHAFRARL